MSVFRFIKSLFAGAARLAAPAPRPGIEEGTNSEGPRGRRPPRPPPARYGVGELARRLDVSLDELSAIRPVYRVFTIPKRGGGYRTISAPEQELKRAQRRILHLLLGRLATHPAATGFERGRSIVSNAQPHTGRSVVMNLDIMDFFKATSSQRVGEYFRGIGWNADAANLLLGLCTWDGGLPQGAPTSPKLSNVVNCELDARLSGLADKLGAMYTRYSDDITFSLAEDNAVLAHTLIRVAKLVLAEYGYRLHERRKLHIRRRHDRQVVTGLVVNNTVNLPRDRRRWLRAVEHHLRSGRDASLSREQLDGWRSFEKMVVRQAGKGP